MRKSIAFVLAASALTGCADLRVLSTQAIWETDLKVAAALIVNQGRFSSGTTSVLFEGVETTPSPSPPQVSLEVTPLDRGESLIRIADFGALASSSNAFLANVRKINVRVDPANAVFEGWFGGESNNTDSRDVPASAHTCINFNGIAAGTVYGPPQAAGTVVITQAGATVSVENFRDTGTGVTFGRADVVPAPTFFGAGNVLKVNNITLDFNFGSVPTPVKQVYFRFADLGGFENFAANGVPSPVYAGELTAVPPIVGSAYVATASASIPGGRRGVVAVIERTSPISRMRVGGQEFFLDDVCFR